jgi:hypothetical protein
MKHLLLALSLALGACSSNPVRLPPKTILAPPRPPIPAKISAKCFVPNAGLNDNALFILKITRDELKSCAAKKAALGKLYNGSR